MVENEEVREKGNRGKKDLEERKNKGKMKRWEDEKGEEGMMLERREEERERERGNGNSGGLKEKLLKKLGMNRRKREKTERKGEKGMMLERQVER